MLSLSHSLRDHYHSTSPNWCHVGSKHTSVTEQVRPKRRLLEIAVEVRRQLPVTRKGVTKCQELKPLEPKDGFVQEMTF